MNFNNLLDFNTVVGLISSAIIVVFGIVVFVRFSLEFSFRNSAKKNEKIILLNMINDRLINMNDDVTFILDMENDTMSYSNNMGERLGWTFPPRLTSDFNGDPRKYWQIWEEDIPKLKKLFSDAIDGRVSEDTLGILSANLDYPVFQVKLYPIQNKNNETVYIVGTITDNKRNINNQ